MERQGIPCCDSQIVARNIKVLEEREVSKCGQDEGEAVAVDGSAYHTRLTYVASTHKTNVEDPSL